MSGISTNFGTSALHALQQLSARTASLVDRISSPDAALDPSQFAETLVEMNEVRLQAKATIAVMHTANSLADELLSRPRR